MKRVGTVASRELRSLFVSPVAYVVLTLFAVLGGFFFLSTVLSFNEYLIQLQQFQVFDELAKLNQREESASDARKALDLWTMSRAYPKTDIPADRYFTAYATIQLRRLFGVGLHSDLPDRGGGRGHTPGFLRPQRQINCAQR